MKRIYQLIAALLIIGLVIALPALAGTTAPHQTHEKMEMTPTAPKGQLIRETTVDGYTLTYHLLDMKALMPDMAGMTGTYHLMVAVTDPRGVTVKKATVGYLVKGPDGNVQKVMAMGMAGGFGANVQLTAAGTYTVKVKAVIGGTELIDAFTYDKI